MYSNLEPFEYHGYILIFTSLSKGLMKAICKELDFSRIGSCYYEMQGDFKRFVDETLENKQMSYSDTEKELNRLKLLLFTQPEVFYGTRQVYDLLTLAEDLLAASKKVEEVDFNMKEYYKQLDRLLYRDRVLKYRAKDLQQHLIEIKTLFQGVLDFSLTDVKKHYFERANKGENK